VFLLFRRKLYHNIMLAVFCQLFFQRFLKIFLIIL
jgi:hypothetical protein